MRCHRDRLCLCLDHHRLDERLIDLGLGEAEGRSKRDEHRVGTLNVGSVVPLNSDGVSLQLVWDRVDGGVNLGERDAVPDELEAYLASGDALGHGWRQKCRLIQPDEFAAFVAHLPGVEAADLADVGCCHAHVSLA